MSFFGINDNTARLARSVTVHKQTQTQTLKNIIDDKVSAAKDKQEPTGSVAFDPASLLEALSKFRSSAAQQDEAVLEKQKSTRYAKIQSKLLAGKKLTGEEKKFLKEHYPELAAKVEKIEAEAEQLERRLKNCKSEEEAQQIYMEARMSANIGPGKKDGTALMLVPALERAYNEYLTKGKSVKELNILA